MDLSFIYTPIYDLVKLFYKNFGCRERYKDLINQCQLMHSSIGTGSLAYVVGTKVMDMRTKSEDDERRKSEAKQEQSSTIDSNLLESSCNCSDICVQTSSTTPYNRSEGDDESQYRTSNYYDFPPLPVTNLFEKSDVVVDNKNEVKSKSNDERVSTRRKLRFEEEEDDDGDGDDDDDDDDDHVYDFQINNNVDLVMEENSKCSNKSRIEVTGSESRSDNVEYEMEERKKDVSEIRVLNNTVKSHGRTRSQDRVSEWLWTLHQIGKFLFIVYDNRVIVNVSQIVNYNWSMVVLYTSSNLGAFFIVYCLLFFLIY